MIRRIFIWSFDIRFFFFFFASQLSEEHLRAEETFPAIENSELPYFSWDESCQAKGGKTKLEASKDKWNAGFLCLPAASLPAHWMLSVFFLLSRTRTTFPNTWIWTGVRWGDGADWECVKQRPSYSESYNIINLFINIVLNNNNIVLYCIEVSMLTS